MNDSLEDRAGLERHAGGALGYGVGYSGQPGTMTRAPWRVAACLAMLLALGGCDRKPGDGPSGVTPPANTRTPGMMGAEPGSGPATPTPIGPSGAAVPAPPPEQSILIEEGPRGTAVPQAAGGATNDPYALEREKARDLGNPPASAAPTQVPPPK